MDQEEKPNSQESGIVGVPRLPISQEDEAALQAHNESKSAKWMFHPGDVAGALAINRGLIHKAARALGTTGITVRRYIEEFESVALWWQEALELAYDEIEDTLFELATQDRNVVAAIFYAKTRMRHRGFIENPVDDGGSKSQDIAVIDMPIDEI